MSKRKLLLANNPLLSGPALGERDRSGIPYRQLSLSSIERDPNQPRTHFDEERLAELAESIRTYGVLSPILVKPSAVPGKFILISGERRFRAAHIAKLDSIPVIVDSSEDKSEERTLAMQLVENIQRADLTPLERAHAIGLLRDNYSLSVRDIAERLGISKSMVQRSLEILNLPDDLLNALREGASESKVLLIANIEDPEIREAYLKDLDTLTRADLQKSLEKSKNSAVKSNDFASPEDRRISEEIQRSIGLKARLVRSSANPAAGKLTIDFYSDDDLQEVFRKLVAS